MGFSNERYQEEKAVNYIDFSQLQHYSLYRVVLATLDAGERPSQKTEKKKEEKKEERTTIKNSK